MKPLGVTLRQIRRPAQAMAFGLAGVSTAWAGFLALHDPGGISWGMFVLLALTTLLQLPELVRIQRRRPVATASLSETTPAPIPPEESPFVAEEEETPPSAASCAAGAWLKECVEWPLFNFKRLLEDQPDREVLEWLPDELEQLLDCLEQGHPELPRTPLTVGDKSRVSITELLEHVVAGQHGLLRMRDQRVEVSLGHRRDVVRVHRDLVFDALATLIGEVSAQLGRANFVAVRTKEFSGILSVIVYCPRKRGRLTPAVFARVGRTLTLDRVELWEDVDGWLGFGLALPLVVAGKRRKPQRKKTDRRADNEPRAAPGVTATPVTT